MILLTSDGGNIEITGKQFTQLLNQGYIGFTDGGNGEPFLDANMEDPQTCRAISDLILTFEGEKF
jgi:hypothetical protein